MKMVILKNMPIDVLEPLAKALNTTPAYLMGWQEPHQLNESIISDQTEGYYVDPEAAEFAEYLRTRPGARMLFLLQKIFLKRIWRKQLNI